MAIFSKLFRMPARLKLDQFQRYKKPNSPWPGYKDTKKYRKNLWMMNLGIFFTIFALWYAMVPLYRSFWQAFGLIGDNMQKDYSQIVKDGTKIHLHRKFNITFEADIDPELDWTFVPVQRTVTVHSGEPALMFYKAYNTGKKPLVGIALYSVFPEDVGYYFSKIQWFWFNQQVINAKEELWMPLYFYLEPEIDDDKTLQGWEDITIIYKFYLAKNQDVAKWMENQQKWEFEQKHFLREKRKLKLAESGESTDKIIDEANMDSSLLESSFPSFELGKMKPNDITQFKNLPDDPLQNKLAAKE